MIDVIIYGKEKGEWGRIKGTRDLGDSMVCDYCIDHYSLV